jgi:predicted nucleic acid-binding protein
MTQGCERVIPNEVAQELQVGADQHPALQAIFSLPWLAIVELDLPTVIQVAAFKGELGGLPRQHLGESAVLALVKVHGGVGIIDDAAAKATARHHGLPVRGTLSLIILGHKQGLLKRAEAESLVDQLTATDMRLPVDGPGLFAWAYEQGLLP